LEIWAGTAKTQHNGPYRPELSLGLCPKDCPGGKWWSASLNCSFEQASADNHLQLDASGEPAKGPLLRTGLAAQIGRQFGRN
jgi:hypothetical protein